MDKKQLSVDILLQNRQRKIAVDLPSLRHFADSALAAVLSLDPLPGDTFSSFAEQGEISIVLVSDRAMARFHLDFMSIPGPTDVLTFDHGEILISAQTAAFHAPDFGHTAQQEIALYILHGLLHLRGYDDLTSSDHKKMHRAQNQIFATLLA